MAAPPLSDSVRVIQNQPYRLLSCGLLVAAIVCLVMLELRVHRRAHGAEERLASALAGALRSGSLEFSDHAPASRLGRLLWTEPDEEEEQATERASMPSRYALIAYDRILDETPLNCVTRLVGADTAAVDKDLLRGVPLYLLKPGVERSVSEVERKPLPPARWLLRRSPESDPAAAE
jgi:hypothetical protein